MQHHSFEIKDKTRLGFWKSIQEDKEQAKLFAISLGKSIKTCMNISHPRDIDTTGRVTKKQRSEYTGVFFEFPVLNNESASLPAFFVLTPSDKFLDDTGDSTIFDEKFQKDSKEIVSFQSLAGDGLLVSPRPNQARNCYSRHLMPFIQSAPEELVVDLLQTLASRVVEFYEDHGTVYVSTSGLAVPWLHMRVFSYPKYYMWKGA